MDRLEFRHVRAFLSVAQHLHFARAAEALDMAPPALTRQIQEAERVLGSQDPGLDVQALLRVLEEQAGVP